MNKGTHKAVLCSSAVWCVLQIVSGLLLPFICWTIKFTADETESNNTKSVNEVAPINDVPDELSQGGGLARIVANIMTQENDVDRRAKEVTKNSKSDADSKKSKKKKLLTGNKFIYALYYF